MSLAVAAMIPAKTAAPLSGAGEGTMFGGVMLVRKVERATGRLSYRDVGRREIWASKGWEVAIGNTGKPKCYDLVFLLIFQSEK